MNKTMAKKIAQSGITVGRIKAMLRRAYDAGAADARISNCNPGFTKATCFNILWKGYTEPDCEIVKGLGDVMGATNALREFGEYWDGDISEYKTQRHSRTSGTPVHQEPIDIYAEPTP
jgi:hypothetical protein